MFRGFDVVLHVADEHRFVGRKLIFDENFRDIHALVQDFHVRLVDERAQTSDAGLKCEMVAMHCAQQKSADAVFTAKMLKIAGGRQFDDGILHLFEVTMKPFF